MRRTSGPRKDREYKVKFTEKMWEDLSEFAESKEEDVSVIVRAAIEKELTGAASLDDETGEPDRSVEIPYLGTSVCGPWEKVVAESGTVLTLNQAVIKELEANGSDMFIRARGRSMEGAGIFDGALVLFRPLHHDKDPRYGEIALVQVISEAGEYESSIKRWCDRDEQNVPILQDGEGKIFIAPKGTKTVVPIGVARGIISHL